MFSEDELIPLSALQHLIFCERRAALIYIEAIWDDNLYTVEGSLLHEKTHSMESESRGDIRISRGLPLRSLRLGLAGKADVVEFHRVARGHEEYDAGNHTASGITLEGATGLWQPFPVEYKRGKLRHEEGYEVQLCAQAMCLEEMLGVCVLKGAIYYGKSVRRQELTFEDDLRRKTEKAAERLHELLQTGHTPDARYSSKCEKCSLLDACLPKVMGKRRSVNTYLMKSIDLLEDARDETPS